MTHSHNVTVVIQTPIGEVHAECRVTPAERERFTGGMPATDPPDPGEAEIVGRVYTVVSEVREATLTRKGLVAVIETDIDDPAAILFWTPRVIIDNKTGHAPGPIKSTDRRDINNYTSLEAMILDKAMEEA